MQGLKGMLIALLLGSTSLGVADPATGDEVRLSITPARWGQLWTNTALGPPSAVCVGEHHPSTALLQPRRLVQWLVAKCRCALAQKWNRYVPARLHTGTTEAAVQVRYQGSAMGRLRGGDHPSWNGELPTVGPVRLLNWKVKFERDSGSDDRQALVLRGLGRSCPQLSQYVGFRLFREAGVPVPETDYARLYVNGHFYHLVLTIESMRDVVSRYERRPAARGTSSEAGLLYEASGGNGMPCQQAGRESCGRRYDAKAEAPLAPLQEMLGGLARARLRGVGALRKYLRARFDVPTLISYLVVRNWGAPVDDTSANYYLYRTGTGKWILLPWDLDQGFGFGAGTSSTLFAGKRAKGAGWNAIKDAALFAFEDEYLARMASLSESVLRPDRVAAIADSAYARIRSLTSDSTPLFCDAARARDVVVTFASQRHAFVARQLLETH